MIHTIDTHDQKAFEQEVTEYMEKGYKLSYTTCGYVGEVGDSVYDCQYWMAILIKEEQVVEQDYTSDIAVRMCEHLECEKCPVQLNNYDNRTPKERKIEHIPCCSNLERWIRDNCANGGGANRGNRDNKHRGL